jgi:hypothetical protein
MTSAEERDWGGCACAQIWKRRSGRQRPINP